jgi:hypothetical protein
MSSLKEMGFNDEARNAELLVKYSGNMDLVAE